MILDAKNVAMAHNNDVNVLELLMFVGKFLFWFALDGMEDKQMVNFFSFNKHGNYLCSAPECVPVLTTSRRCKPSQTLDGTVPQWNGSTHAPIQNGSIRSRVRGMSVVRLDKWWQWWWGKDIGRTVNW